MQAYNYYNLRFEMGGWFEERYEALVRMAGLLERMGYDWPACEELYLKAYEFLPIRAEPLYLIARHWYNAKQYQSALLFAAKAYAIPFPTSIRLFINPTIYHS